MTPFPKLKRLTQVARIRGVDVYVHWSVILIAIVILLGAVRAPLVSLVGLSAYLSVLLIHECGHMIAAQRKGCTVLAIELYPIAGFTRCHAPWSRVDVAVIAWGGATAQAVIGIPVVAWLIVFGYSRFEAANAALALLGPFSLAIAAFNLIPVSPLDGATAWDLIPALIHRARTQQRKRMSGWNR